MVTRTAQISPEIFGGGRNTEPGQMRHTARNPHPLMKNIDYSFKILVAVVIAGVVVAFAGPDPAAKTSSKTAAPVQVACAHAAVDRTE